MWNDISLLTYVGLRGLGVARAPLRTVPVHCIRTLGRDWTLVDIITTGIGVVSQIWLRWSPRLSALTTPNCTPTRIDLQLEVAHIAGSRTSSAWHGRCKAWVMDGMWITAPLWTFPIQVILWLSPQHWIWSIPVHADVWSWTLEFRGYLGKMSQFETTHFLGAFSPANGTLERGSFCLRKFIRLRCGRTFP